jgi:hypothetical protein
MTVDGPAPQSECAHIAAGVARTVAEGCAEVAVLLEYSFPGEAADDALPAEMSLQYRGVVDFRSDRASLADASTSLILDGSVTYQKMPDGVWTHTRHAQRAGHWTPTHPRWALEVLRQGCRSAAPDGEPDVVELDRDRAADLTHPGLNPDWQLRGRTAFDDDGRLRRVEIMMAGSASPETSMRATVEFIRFDQAAAQIDLPLESVDLTGYLNAPSLKQ